MLRGNSWIMWLKSRIPKKLRDRMKFGMNNFLFIYRFISSSKRQLPDFLIIGAQKSGTTTLYNLLIEHPEIESAIRKEVHYFDLNYHKGIKWYKSHFPIFKKNNVLTGEASPYYIFHPEVPYRIKKTLKGVKLIVMLRNPIARAYSQYNHNIRVPNREYLSFEDALLQEERRLRGEVAKMAKNLQYKSKAHMHYSYKARGRYADQIGTWLDKFQRKDILFIRSEDFFNDTQFVLKEVYTFLDIRDNFISNNIRSKSRNIGKYEKDLPGNTYALLKKEYIDLNKDLKSIIGKNFAGWRM